MLSLASPTRLSKRTAETVGAPQLTCVSISRVASLIASETGGPQCLRQWLTARELSAYSAFTIPKRRSDWLAGRLAAKFAVVEREGLSSEALGGVEICASTSSMDRGRPVYTIEGEPGRFGLSIAHSADTAVAALAPRLGDEIGVDVEQVRSPTSLEGVALSQRERQQVFRLAGAERDRAVSLIWVMKEALLKALGLGLRMPLGQLSVHLEQLDCFTTADSRTPFSANRRFAYGGQLFSIDARAAHLHPLLPRLDRLPMVASVFSLGEAMGCWITLPRWEDSWTP